jgi:molecular chaperone GrpE
MNEQEDVEAILDRFRRWLEATRLEARSIDPLAEESVAGQHSEAGDFGLIDLVEAFTALRHEVKLQTKSGRGLCQQLETAIGALRQAGEQLRSVEPKEAQAVWAAGKAMAEALADLDEALERGQREIEKAQQRFVDASARALESDLQKLGTGHGWLGRRAHEAYQREVMNVVRNAGWVPHDVFNSLLEGYGVIQNRLRRTMASEAIERIVCLGNPVDPERMTVIEVVDCARGEPGTVVKELRRGYTWNGRVIRYAEVQAARDRGTLAIDPAAPPLKRQEHEENPVGADSKRRAGWLDVD